jgi:hypothetical protein
MDAGADAVPKDVRPADMLSKDVPLMVNVYGVPIGDAYLDRPPMMDVALSPDTTDSANDIVPSVDARDDGS